MTKTKLAGLLFILVGVPFGITALDGLFPPSLFVSQGLLLIFFSKERIDDERVQQLKMKALYTTMGAAFGLTFAAYAVVAVLLRGSAPPPGELHRLVTAWDFLAGLLAVSLGFFHLFRWQDGRSVHA